MGDSQRKKSDFDVEFEMIKLDTSKESLFHKGIYSHSPKHRLNSIRAVYLMGLELEQ